MRFSIRSLSSERTAEKRQGDSSARTPSRSRRGRARQRRQGAPRAGRRNAEGARGAAEEARKRLPLPMQASRRPGLSWTQAQFYHRQRRRPAGRLACCSWRSAAALLALGALASPARFGLPRWFAQLPAQAARQEVPRGVPRTPSTSSCAASSPACRSTTACGSSPPKRAEPVKAEFRAIVESQQLGMPIGGRRAQAVRAHAVPGGELLRHRHPDPAEGRRQPVRGARQPFARAARPQEDEGARSRRCRMEAKASAGIIGALPIIVMVLVYLTSPSYIDAAVHRADRPRSILAAARLLDVDRHLRHAQDDQLRLLRRTAMLDMIIDLDDLITDPQLLAWSWPRIAVVRHGLHASPCRCSSGDQLDDAHEVGRASSARRSAPRERARLAARARSVAAARRAEAVHASASSTASTCARRWTTRRRVSKLRMAGFRGQTPLVTFLFFRLVAAVRRSSRSRCSTSSSSTAARPAAAHQARHLRRRRLSSASMRRSSTSAEHRSASASSRSAAPGRTRSTCC